MPEATIREQVRRLGEQLPEDATWEDVLHEISALRTRCRNRDSCPVSGLPYAYIE